jgi:DNA-binding CsgD family transcriptional regulator
MTVVLTTDAGIDAALAAATREVLVASRCGDPLRRADRDNLRRGVPYRILLDERVHDMPALVLRLGSLTEARAQIRTLPGLPAELTVVDMSTALLPARPDAARAELVLMRLPSVVATAVALFEQLWPAARPLSAWSADLGARDRDLLALLSAGCTDESAAACLGVSVRTVRRTMAAIMRQLGARSRFQAGLKAADHGLLA